MTDPELPAIRTARLELPALSVPQYERLLAGDAAAVGRELDALLTDEWLADARWLIALRREQLRAHADHLPWLIRPIIRREDDAPAGAIGYVNFHGAPSAEGVAEIGYALLPRWRGRGYAIEAVRATLAWAARDPRVRVLRASVAPDNAPSLRLIAKLGFVQTGEQWDPDDGLELVHDLPREAFADDLVAG